MPSHAQSTDQIEGPIREWILVALLKASNDRGYRQKRMLSRGIINKTHLIAKGQ